MARISFIDCAHHAVQQFTDYCLECGYNINMTNEQYLAELTREVREQDPTIQKIRAMEKKLGIGV